jgi:large subunit ribosomal protein L18
MIMKLRTRADYRTRRHLRVRQKVTGTAEKPRMCVFVSNKHMYVQFIDDTAKNTLVSVSTVLKEVKDASKGKNTVAVAKQLGQLAAKAAKGKDIEAVVFDRGGFAFKGRVKALADAARDGGLKF